MKEATCVDCGEVRMVREYSEAKRCQPCARKRWLRSEHAKKAEAQNEEMTALEPRGWKLARFAPLEIITVSGENFARANCARCGGHAVEKLERPLPEPNVLRKRFVAAGWGVKRKCTCPHCLRPKKVEPKEKPVKQPFKVKFTPKAPSYIQALDAQKLRKNTMKNNVTPIAVKAPNDDTSDAAKQARRDAHSMLELYFDIQNGCFKEGYSDKRIAEETGAAELWVIKRREEEFGALGAPPEIQEMRMEIISMGRDIAQLIERMEATYKRNGWPL